MRKSSPTTSHHGTTFTFPAERIYFGNKFDSSLNFFFFYIRTRQLTDQGIVNQNLEIGPCEIVNLAKKFMSEPLTHPITATNAFLMQSESRFLDHAFMDTNLILACVQPYPPPELHPLPPPEKVVVASLSFYRLRFNGIPTWKQTTQLQSSKFQVNLPVEETSPSTKKRTQS